MGTRDQDQDDVAEPARPPLTTAQAREVTAGLREAMDDVRRSVAVLAVRVRDAHAACVWVPLGHGIWASYSGTPEGEDMRTASVGQLAVILANRALRHLSVVDIVWLGLG